MRSFATYMIWVQPQLTRQFSKHMTMSTINYVQPLYTNLRLRKGLNSEAYTSYYSSHSHIGMTSQNMRRTVKSNGWGGAGNTNDTGRPVLRCYDDSDTGGGALHNKPKEQQQLVRMRWNKAFGWPYLLVKLRPWGRVLNQSVSHHD